MGKWIAAAAIFGVLLSAVCPSLAAQNNPVPFLNNPVVPGAVTPGEPGLTLTLNGAGFVQGSVVLWNGSVRQTTFVSASRLTAEIPASDIATAASAIITVKNSAPGGGVSNLVIFEVTTPTASLALTRNDNYFYGGIGLGSTTVEPAGLAVGYSPIQDALSLAVVSAGCSAIESCLGPMGTISTLSATASSMAFIEPNSGSIVTGDFNGDGILDFVTLGANLSVNLGKSNGQISSSRIYPMPSAFATANSTPAIGDFNRDGQLDLVIAGYSSVFFLSGNGDGTFGSPVAYSTAVTFGSTFLAAGDFNGDGLLDLAVTNQGDNTLSILIGNGDGTFNADGDYPTGTFPGPIASGDFNNDGIPDLAVVNAGSDATLSVFLGNGDGTFQARVDVPAGVSLYSLSLGDFNGDGNLDIAVSDTRCTNSGCAPSGSVNVLLGNGDGTFKGHLDFPAGALPESVASGDFVPSNPPAGRSGFAVANYKDNSVSIYSSINPKSGANNPVCTISSISPASVVVGSGAFTLTINGTGFGESSVVTFGSVTVASAYVSPMELLAAIPGSEVTFVGSPPITVTNPGAAPSILTSFAVIYPMPVLSTLSPASVASGSPGLGLGITGANFNAGSTVLLNGSSRQTTFLSTTQLVAAIPAGDLAAAGWDQLEVVNPAPGGGPSNAIAFQVTSGSSSSVPGGGLYYVPVAPCRLADTRIAPSGTFTGPSIAGGTSRDFPIPQSTACDIPSTAEAYSLDVAVVPAEPLGYVSVWPSGQTQPGSATLSSPDGRVRSNAAIVAAGNNGAITVFASNTTDVVLDVDGYFLADSSAQQFYPVAPCRVVDTRNPSGLLGGPLLTGNTSRTFPLPTGSCDLPTSARAYSLNLAVVPRSPLGYITAWATGQAQPLTANLSSVTGTVTASAAIVPAGTNGSIDVFASNSTDLIVDVNGYFGPAGTGGLSLFTVPPCRALDTRNPSNEAPGTGQAFTGELVDNLQASGCGLPKTAQAFVVNATVVPSVPFGYLTLWPEGTAQPLAATLSAIDQSVTSNLAIVPANNGSIGIYASNATQLVLDLLGFFAAP
jgi:hypothetical protein